MAVVVAPEKEFEEKAAVYRRRTEEAMTVAFHLLDVHSCNQIDIELCVMLLKELERPVFAVFDYETSRVEIQNTKQMVADLQAAHRAAAAARWSQRRSRQSPWPAPQSLAQRSRLLISSRH